MNRKTTLWTVFLLVFMATSFFTGCSAPEEGPMAPRQSRYTFLLPVASGLITHGDDIAAIDVSHTEEGYFMARYTGAASKAKLQVTAPTGVLYTYTLYGDSYETFPLSGGNGEYHIDILEHAYDDMYALVFSHDLNVTVSDSFKPFLYPNQYAWYTADSDTVQLGIRLSEQSTGDLDYVEQVYEYIIENISYDTALATHAPIDYIPDIDGTLAKGTGICFDYAALMTALLRSQGVPTRLEVGYSGTAYHAWISVYLEEIGWVDDIIRFDGKSWSLMDPTLAANNTSQSTGEYIGDGSNYIVKYSY